MAAVGEPKLMSVGPHEGTILTPWLRLAAAWEKLDDCGGRTWSDSMVA